ncbi:MAG: Ig-like domain-containing protein [Flavobacteriaceae bacterium]|nr:Ig-like domain-containing protein [Flavobacteriaceae bacterium]
MKTTIILITAILFLQCGKVSQEGPTSISNIVMYSANDSYVIRGANVDLQLLLEITPSDADISKVLWSVDNKSIATIDEHTGLLTSRDAGSINVTVKTTDGSNLEASEEFTILRAITPSIKSIEIKSTINSYNIEGVNSPLQLYLDISPNNSNHSKIEWTVSDESVISINENGLVTSLAIGSSNVIVNSTDGSNIESFVEISVSKKDDDNQEGETDDSSIVIHESNKVISYQMSQQDYDSWVQHDDFMNDWTKTKPIMDEIYDKFNDNFDFVFFILNETDKPSSIGYYGLNISGVNNVSGIGRSIVSQANINLGSSNKMKSIMQIPYLSGLKSGPTLHEILHNWGNFVLNTKTFTDSPNEVNSIPHWGFSSAGGQLGGFDINTLEENVDGDSNKYKASMGSSNNFGLNANGGNGLPYSNIELYLMGLIPESEVQDLVMFSGLTTTQEDYNNGVFYANTKTIVTISDIVSEHGARSPSFINSQKDFRLLVVVLTPSQLTLAQWNIISDEVDWFTEQTMFQNPSHLYNFHQATLGKATMNATIYSEDIK